MRRAKKTQQATEKVKKIMNGKDCKAVVSEIEKMKKRKKI